MKNRRLVVLVDKPFEDRLRKASREESRPVADMVREAVGQYLTRKESAEKIDRLIEAFKTGPRIPMGKYKDPQKMNELIGEMYERRHAWPWGRTSTSSTRTSS